jgi:hypothetical protein
MNVLKIVPAAIAFAFAVSAEPASAISVTVGGTSVANEGQISSLAGLLCQKESFNDSLADDCAAAGVAYTTIASNFVTGNSDGIYASPPNNTSGYLTVSPTSGNPVTINLTSPVNYFGFYVGSLDDFNSITFNFTGGTQTFDGVFLNNKAFGTAPTGNQGQGAYFNVFADAGQSFTQIVLSSSQSAFETDNHAFGVAAVPAPGVLALLGVGLLGLMAGVRRQR